MRTVILAALCGVALSVGTAAEAQDSRLVINVKPRSWLDAGGVVPVGSMQNYMYDTQGGSDSDRFSGRTRSATLLPDRFSGGRGFTFETPSFR